MSEAVRLCMRETVLYQDPEISSLVEKLYVELLQALEICHKSLSKSEVSAKARSIVNSDAMERPMARIRELSQKVFREVDYRHRLEMREASHRLVDMQVEQRKILKAIEDQKRVLQALQEERSIMSLVQEQQKTVQIVQDIQRRLQQANLLQEAAGLRGDC